MASLSSCHLFFSSRRRHTRCLSDWSSDVCSSDLIERAHGTPFARGNIASAASWLKEPSSPWIAIFIKPLPPAHQSSTSSCAPIFHFLLRTNLPPVKTGLAPSHPAGGRHGNPQGET